VGCGVGVERERVSGARPASGRSAPEKSATAAPLPLDTKITMPAIECGQAPSHHPHQGSRGPGPMSRGDKGWQAHGVVARGATKNSRPAPLRFLLSLTFAAAPRQARLRRRQDGRQVIVGQDVQLAAVAPRHSGEGGCVCVCVCVCGGGAAVEFIFPGLSSSPQTNSGRRERAALTLTLLLFLLSPLGSQEKPCRPSLCALPWSGPRPRLVRAGMGMPFWRGRRRAFFCVLSPAPRKGRAPDWRPPLRRCFGPCVPATSKRQDSLPRARAHGPGVRVPCADAEGRGMWRPRWWCVPQHALAPSPGHACGASAFLFLPRPAQPPSITTCHVHA
jgi:hypothetical protein